MFLVRNMKAASAALSRAVLPDETSRRRLRFVGALLGCSVPLALAIAAYLAFPMVLLVAFLAYAAVIGGVVGAWRAPTAARAESGDDEAGKAAAAGVVIGTAILTGASLVSLLL